MIDADEVRPREVASGSGSADTGSHTKRLVGNLERYAFLFDTRWQTFGRIANRVVRGALFSGEVRNGLRRSCSDRLAVRVVERSPCCVRAIGLDVHEHAGH